jgi:hypothetical protein
MLNGNERFLYKANGLVPNISMCVAMEDCDEIEPLGKITGDSDE